MVCISLRRENLSSLHDPVESALTWSQAHPNYEKNQEEIQNKISMMEKEIIQFKLKKEKLTLQKDEKCES